MAEVFANPLVDLAEYTDMKQDLDKGKGPVQISGGQSVAARCDL